MPRNIATSKDMDDIAAFMRTMKFRKKLFGGVDEADVWRQLEQLQHEYRNAYETQETRYQTILELHGISLEADAAGVSAHSVRPHEADGLDGA